MSFLGFAQHAADAFFLGMVVGIPVVGAYKGVAVFDTFVEGAKGGINVVVRIVPYLIAMIVAIGMFRASGGFDRIASWSAPILTFIHMPPDLLPLALVRPFSGAASNGILADVISRHGGDSVLAQTAATMMGSTETTFYVIAVYFGAVQIRKTRHAIAAGLIADFVGVVAAITICRAILG